MAQKLERFMFTIHKKLEDSLKSMKAKKFTLIKKGLPIGSPGKTTN